MPAVRDLHVQAYETPSHIPGPSTFNLEGIAHLPLTRLLLCLHVFDGSFIIPSGALSTGLEVLAVKEHDIPNYLMQALLRSTPGGFPRLRRLVYGSDAMHGRMLGELAVLEHWAMPDLFPLPALEDL